MQRLSYPEHAKTKLVNIKTIILNSDSFSWCSDQATSNLPRNMGHSCLQHELFLPSQEPRMTLGPTQAPIQLEQEAFPFGEEKPGY